MSHHSNADLDPDLPEDVIAIWTESAYFYCFDGPDLSNAELIEIIQSMQKVDPN